MVYDLMNSGFTIKSNYRYVLRQENLVLFCFLLKGSRFTGKKVLSVNCYRLTKTKMFWDLFEFRNYHNIENNTLILIKRYGTISVM